jgi:hypothetical protein
MRPIWVTNIPSTPVEKALAHFSSARLRADSRVGGPVFLDRRRPRQLADGRPLECGPSAPASAHPEAMVRVFAARTVRWRIFAVHTWIIVKEKGAATYSRYDYTAWGDPIRSNGFAADGRWFGATPETVVAVDGERAEGLIPKMRYVIENYKFRAYGDYSA